MSNIKHPLRKVWNRIKYVCKHKNKTLFEEWSNYDNFYDYWIKLYDKNKSLGLIDMDGDYLPSNMSIQTRAEIAAKVAQKTKGTKRGPRNPDITRKMQETCMIKYGTKHPQKLQSVKNKVVQNNLQKYGVEHTTQLPDFIDKVKATSMIKYGTEFPMQSDVIKNKSIQSNIKNGKIHIYDGKSSTEKAKELGLPRTTFQQRVAKYGYDIAINIKTSQTEIEYIMADILKILNIQHQTEQTIGNYRADFVLPEFNIIIECDGLYWHSDAKCKNKYYHRDKQLFYKKLGYKSLFFREDEIHTKRNIIESMIAHRCKLSSPIYARKCTIEELPHKEIKQFFIDNHLMGNGSGKGIALKYEGEIVAACQIVQRDYVDISRFCTKPNTHVIGGFSKILSFIDKKYKKNIHTFIDARYGDGEYLKELGFELKNKDISFKWVKDDKTFHRLKYKGNTGYENRCFKIWDCGQYKYIKKAVTSTA